MTTLARHLPYRGARFFLIWLAIDLAVTLILFASVGGSYLAWRHDHQWTLLLTLPPILFLWNNKRRPAMSARKRRIRKQLRMIRYWYTMKPR